MTANRAVDKTLGTTINGANPGNKSQDALDAVERRGLAGPPRLFAPDAKHIGDTP